MYLSRQEEKYYHYEDNRSYISYVGFPNNIPDNPETSTVSLWRGPKTAVSGCAFPNRSDRLPSDT